MGRIVYGSDPPKFDFQQKPDGSLSITVRNKTTIWYDERFVQTLTWGHMVLSTEGVILPPPAVVHMYRYYGKNFEERLKGTLKDFTEITESPAEKAFFEQYVQLVQNSEEPLDSPALIPQVWVNWIHYDPLDKRRAELVKRQPFRVDFIVVDKEINPKWIVIEIDGPSHFAKQVATRSQIITYEPDLESFTVHLKRDRWLREQGFQVYRFSNLEVEKDFEEIIQEVFGNKLGYTSKGMCFERRSGLPL